MGLQLVFGLPCVCWFVLDALMWYRFLFRWFDWSWVWPGFRCFGFGGGAVWVWFGWVLGLLVLYFGVGFELCGWFGRICRGCCFGGFVL